MTTIFINGKFVAQRTTGVQRLAMGLLLALDSVLAERGTNLCWVLLCPSTVEPPDLRIIRVKYIGPRNCNLHVWEQIYLPLYTLGRILLNLSGAAPLMKRDQVCMIPDAAVFDLPSAYTVPYRIWYRLLFRTVSKTARCLLTISEFSRGRLVNSLGDPAKRLRIIDCAATHISSIRPDDRIIDRLQLGEVQYFLAVGSLNPTKNLSRLADAFTEIAETNIRLVLVGGENNLVFAGHGERNFEDSRIVCTGAINDAELAALYSRALAFVFPSLYEGFGIPPLESMSLGCPVIAARVASIPEICMDAACYFDPMSTPDITRVLREVLDDSSLREQLKRLGKVRALHFTWDRSALQLIEYLIKDEVISIDSIESFGGT